MIKYLFRDPDILKRDIKNKFIYIFLDYDGTLTNITTTPEKALMPRQTRTALRRLSELPKHKIAIVSGRSLKDVIKKIRLRNNIVYVGNHGFEIKGPKIKFKSPVPLGYRKALEEIREKLNKALARVKGVFVEDKGFSLSLHYRLADKKDIQKIKTEFYSVLVPYEVRHNVIVATGKKIFEVRSSANWNKGKVVLWLLARQKFLLKNKKTDILPVYIGDDVTDEDAFEALKNKGLTIRVGKLKKSSARYYVRDVKEVVEFLERLITSSRGHEKCRRT